MPSSAMWRRVDIVLTDVSEELITSSPENPQAMNQREQVAAGCSVWFLACGVFYPENGDDTFLRNVGLYNIYTSQKTAFFIVIAAKTSHLA
jgi:hypothetical protein